MALSTARIHRVRGRPPFLAAGIKSLIHSHSSSVKSLGYVFSFISLFYTTHEDFSDRLSGDFSPNDSSLSVTLYPPKPFVALVFPIATRTLGQEVHLGQVLHHFVTELHGRV